MLKIVSVGTTVAVDMESCAERTNLVAILPWKALLLLIRAATASKYIIFVTLKIAIYVRFNHDDVNNFDWYLQNIFISNTPLFEHFNVVPKNKTYHYDVFLKTHFICTKFTENLGCLRFITYYCTSFFITVTLLQTRKTLEV